MKDFQIDIQLWSIFIRNQTVIIDYFGKGQHRYFDTDGIRVAGDTNHLKAEYNRWLQKELAIKMNLSMEMYD